jgi:hypothetical protein
MRAYGGGQGVAGAYNNCVGQHGVPPTLAPAPTSPAPPAEWREDLTPTPTESSGTKVDSSGSWR